MKIFHTGLDMFIETTMITTDTEADTEIGVWGVPTTNPDLTAEVLAKMAGVPVSAVEWDWADWGDTKADFSMFLTPEQVDQFMEGRP